MAPVEVEKVPDTQPTHATCPALGWYVPTPQFVQTLALAEEYMPLEQLTHDVWPVTGWFVPLAQLEHAFAPAAE